MAKLRIIVGNLSQIDPSPTSGLKTLLKQDGILVEGAGLFHQWNSGLDSTYMLLGDVVGVRQADAMLSLPSQVKIETERLENPERIPEVEGRYILDRKSVV